MTLLQGESKLGSFSHYWSILEIIYDFDTFGEQLRRSFPQCDKKVELQTLKHYIRENIHHFSN